MRKRFLLPALAMGLLACSFGAMNAEAGTVGVTSDEGSFNFTITSEGGGALQFDYSNVLLTTINGAAIPGGSIASTFATAHITATLTATYGPFTTYSISEPTPGVKTFGTPGPGVTSSTVMYNAQTTGGTVTGFLDLNGTVVLGSPPSATLQTSTTGSTIYNFAAFTLPGQITLTYTQVGADFAALIAGPAGHSISGSGSFTELAVPEPSSMALLGIGISCLFGFRRRFRSKVNA